MTRRYGWVCDNANPDRDAECPMITLYDYLPSQNGWKVRQLLHHLALPHRTEIVSLFEGRGQESGYRAVNPWGAVPAIRLEDGRVLSESNAILWYLSDRTPYRPEESFAQAKVFQWLSFEWISRKNVPLLNRSEFGGGAAVAKMLPRLTPNTSIRRSAIAANHDVVMICRIRASSSIS